MAFISIFMFSCGDEPLTKTDDTVTLHPQAIVSDAPVLKSGDQILGNPDYLVISYCAFRAETRE